MSSPRFPPVREARPPLLSPWHARARGRKASVGVTEYEQGQSVRAAAGRSESPPFVPPGVMRRPAVRLLRAALWAGMAASGLGAEYVRTTWLPHDPAFASALVAVMLGCAGSALCWAGLEAIKATARREWRAGRGTVLQGRHNDTVAIPEPAYGGRLEALERKAEDSERKLGEVFALMQLVCDELRVDTTPADETRPMLRVILGGEAG